MGVRQDYCGGSHEAAESEAEHVLSEGQKVERGQVIPVPSLFRLRLIFF